MSSIPQRAFYRIGESRSDVLLAFSASSSTISAAVPVGRCSSVRTKVVSIPSFLYRRMALTEGIVSDAGDVIVVAVVHLRRRQKTVCGVCGEVQFHHYDKRPRRIRDLSSEDSLTRQGRRKWEYGGRVIKRGSSIGAPTIKWYRS
jgi:hypothetical protein